MLSLIDHEGVVLLLFPKEAEEEGNENEGGKAPSESQREDSQHMSFKRVRDQRTYC
jgi:hypothetical protein